MRHKSECGDGAKEPQTRFSLNSSSNEIVASESQNAIWINNWINPRCTVVYCDVEIIRFTCMLENRNRRNNRLQPIKVVGFGMNN